MSPPKSVPSDHLWQFCCPRTKYSFHIWSPIIWCPPSFPQMVPHLKSFPMAPVKGAYHPALGVGMAKFCGVEAKVKVERKYFWYCFDNIGFPKRVNHAIAMYEDEKSDEATVFSIGGFPDPITGSERLRSTDIDVRKFDVTSRTWNLVKTRSKQDDALLAPCARSRYGHSMCSYNGKIYIYGGRNDEDRLMKEVSCFDISTSSWVNCHTSGQAPDASLGHSCTLIGSTMFIHGGFCSIESKCTNTLHGLNLETLIWKLYPCAGTNVEERFLHTATAVGNYKIVIFGGVSGHISSMDAVYDERFYSYDLRDGKWSPIVTTGYKPMGRRSHIAANFRKSIIYFGGYTPIKDIHFADVFILNVTTYHITEVRPWGEYPCARRRPACALVGSELIICGGTSPVLVGENKQRIMFDHSDTFVLNLFPSLQEMCFSFILNHDMDYSSLPPHLHSYLMKLNLLDKKRNEKEFT